MPSDVIEAFKEEEKIRLEEEEARKKAAMSTTVEIIFEKDIMTGPPNKIEVLNKEVSARKFTV